jgi:hypothetical protein
MSKENYPLLKSTRILSLILACSLGANIVSCASRQEADPAGITSQPELTTEQVMPPATIEPDSTRIPEDELPTPMPAIEPATAPEEEEVPENHRSDYNKAALQRKLDLQAETMTSVLEEQFGIEDFTSIGQEYTFTSDRVVIYFEVGRDIVVEREDGSELIIEEGSVIVGGVDGQGEVVGASIIAYPEDVDEFHLATEGDYAGQFIALENGDVRYVWSEEAQAWAEAVLESESEAEDEIQFDYSRR